ncbi:YceD family protein [Aquimarina rhabdastrellae]
MKQLKEYTIPFVGLKQGVHQFEYQIDNTFFQHFEYDDFNDASLDVNLEFNKKTTLFELTFTVKGTVNVNCDLTNEPFDLPIEDEFLLIVKFGNEYNDENEEILILPHGDYEINVQQFIYELIVLALPSKRIHPGVEDGSLESELLDKLDELSPKEKEAENDSEEIDPRWDKLKNLLNDNK